MYVREIFEGVLLERHEHIVTLLGKYADDPSIYITFTDLPKLGINPQYSYDTPAGIYAYPLEKVWDQVVNDSLPFASGRKFVQVIRAVANIKDVSQYSGSDFVRDITKLKELYGSLVTQNDVMPEFRLSTLSSLNKNTDLDSEFPSYKPEKDLFDAAITTWERSAYDNTFISKFWNITRNIGKLVARTRGSKSSAGWNKVLRSLGYDGFSDKAGLGIIHSNEPIQAVFLTACAVTLVETLHNVRKYDGIKILLYDLNDLAELIRTPQSEKNKADLIKSAYVMQEWPQLLLHGYSTHFEVVGTHEEFLRSGFDYFVPSLLKRDFNVLPTLLNELMYNAQLKNRANILADCSPKTVNEAKLYLDTTLGSYAGFLMDHFGLNDRDVIFQILRRVRPFMAGKGEKNLKKLVGRWWFKVTNALSPKDIQKLTN